MEERRKEYPEMLTDIALIKQKIEFIEEKVCEISKKVSNVVQVRDFDSHVILDRWMFGIIITLLTSVLLKVFHVL